MVMIKIVLLLFIGAAFAADDNFSKAVKKVAGKYCKDNLPLKDKLEYLKCEALTPKEVKDHLYDCIKKFEDHSHETSVRPIFCYFVENEHPKSEKCMMDYEKEHIKTAEDKHREMQIELMYNVCLLSLPMD